MDVGCPLLRTDPVSLLQGTSAPETLKPLLSAQPPQWRCYARLVTPQHVFLTFLPATFSGILSACPICTSQTPGS